jgi:hypothetical protein
MKLSKQIMAGVLLIGVLAAPWSAFAAEKESDKKAEKAGAKKTGKTKPYILKTCPVADGKLGEMGKPVVLIQDGREIQLCCKDCVKDFQKDTAKYIKKIESAELKLDNKAGKKAEKEEKKKS